MPIQRTTILEQIKNLQQGKLYLAILSLLLVAVFIWIMTALFTTQKAIPITPELKKMSQSLTPNFNESVFEELETKRYYTASELENFTVFTLKSDSRTGEQNIIKIENNLINMSQNTESYDSFATEDLESNNFNSFMNEGVESNNFNNTVFEENSYSNNNQNTESLDQNINNLD